MSTASVPVFKRVASFSGLVAIGIVAFLVLTNNRLEPKRRPLSEQGRAVRVLEIQSMQVVPRAVGYGIVEARREWEMVAQVAGRVIEMSDQLREGTIIPAGTELIKIDPEDYELAATKQQASVDAIKAQLGELKVQESNARATLKIERRSLEIAQGELDRTQSLFDGGNASRSDVDAAELAVLTQRKVVQSLENSLRELPASRRVLSAQIEQSEAGLAGANLDITRTTITAPFDIRVRDVRAELREVVGAGQVLAVADGIEVAEVPAQFPLGALRPLVPFRPAVTPLSTEVLSRLPELSGITASVRLDSADFSAQWDARLDRFAGVDSQTRTIRVVAAVDDPFRALQPGIRPPLTVGMYVQVELQGQPKDDCLAVPRSALHGNVLHIADEQQRLQRRTVEVQFRQSEFVCLASGIEPGERIVLTDLIPAIEGMLLDPRLDEDAAAELVDAVSAKGPAQ